MVRICSEGHVLFWQSQPVVRHIPAGNLLLAAAILLSGHTFTNFANLADVLNLVMFGERRYYHRFPKISVSLNIRHSPCFERNVL